MGKKEGGKRKKQSFVKRREGARGNESKGGGVEGRKCKEKMKN